MSKRHHHGGFAERWNAALRRLCTPRAPRPGVCHGAVTNGEAAASTTDPPDPTDPSPTCPLCRRRPADCLAVNECDPEKELQVCGACLDAALRQGRSWHYLAWRAGLVGKEGVPDLDDEDDDSGRDVR